MELLQANERELEENVAMLSAQQKDTYDAVAAYHLLGHVCQMMAIVAGEGGMGKTFFLHCIALNIRLQHGAGSIAVAAKTTMAAALINGDTFDSLMPVAPCATRTCEEALTRLRSSRLNDSDTSLTGSRAARARTCAAYSCNYCARWAIISSYLHCYHFGSMAFGGRCELSENNKSGIIGWSTV